MSVLRGAERAFAQIVSRLSVCNPFAPERAELECQALGDEAPAHEPVDSLPIRLGETASAVTVVNERVIERTEQLADAMRGRMVDGLVPDGEDVRLYQDLAFYILYYRIRTRFDAAVVGAAPRERICGPVSHYADFLRDLETYFGFPGSRVTSPYEPHHLFALLFQIRRAFYHIFAHIVGGSPAMARLRAAAWNSIFTYDLLRYTRTLHQRMKQVTTLVTGPSGTGKELVARAIGRSQYIPFDPHTRTFAEDAAASFHPLNLSALSPTLIESELFGHTRGAFTGAVSDRVGWLEACSPYGTVFLDEIGETDRAVQVKLLRVLETRSFQRLGDTEDRQFAGKIIAATNRDLGREMRDGRFRKDFYYRLCADMVETPSLAEQLRQAPDELRNMLMFIARKEAGDDEAESLAREVEAFIENRLGRDYEWPGNFRELEQCLRNVMVRREYNPSQQTAASAAERLAREVAAGALTAEELLDHYSNLIHSRTGNWAETARRLGLDRRTVQRRVNSCRHPGVPEGEVDRRLTCDDGPLD